MAGGLLNIYPEHQKTPINLLGYPDTFLIFKYCEEVRIHRRMDPQISCLYFLK